MWNDLSMKNKAAIIDLGVKSGVTDLDNIRNGYNSYARGGYKKWKEAIRNYKGIDIDNDPTYDYEGYYNSNPNRAWDMMKRDSDAHFTDEFKTALHPSFSNESKYSGTVNKFNPKGVIGGTWLGDNIYRLSEDQFNRDWDTDRTLDYLNDNESFPVTLQDPTGSTILRSVTVSPSVFDYLRNGNLLLERLGFPIHNKNQFKIGGNLKRKYRTDKGIYDFTTWDKGYWLLTDNKGTHKIVTAKGTVPPDVVNGAGITYYVDDKGNYYDYQPKGTLQVQGLSDSELRNYQLNQDREEAKKMSESQKKAIDEDYARNVNNTTHLKDVVVTQNSYNEANATPQWGIHDKGYFRGINSDRAWTSNAINHRLRTMFADDYTDRVANMSYFTNWLSPGQWFGAGIDALQGERNFWEGLTYGNSGWVSDNFAKEHPTAAFWLNFVGDTVAGAPVETANLVRASSTAAGRALFKSALKTDVGRNWYLSRAINSSAKGWDGTVGYNYFRDPDSWYRILSRPEVEGIQEIGMNVTSTDTKLFPTRSNNFREFIEGNELTAGTGSNEGYWMKSKNVNTSKLSVKDFFALEDSKPVQSRNRAHGNVSQASLGKPWELATSTGQIFKSGVLEGNTPSMIRTTNNGGRTNFSLFPREEVPIGSRVGFRTGEMPIEGLRYFEELPNGRYSYQGEILPDKHLYYDPVTKSFNTYRSSMLSKFLDDMLDNTSIHSKSTPYMSYQDFDFTTIPKYKEGTMAVRKDMGNNSGAFTSNGSYVEDGYLYPGTTSLSGQRDFTWMNADKPFPGVIGPKNNAYSRMFYGRTRDIPGLRYVRDMQEPVGQWRPGGRKSFVLKSEMVTPDPISLNNLVQYNIDPFSVELNTPWYTRSDYPTMSKYGIFGDLTFWHKKGGFLNKIN